MRILELELANFGALEQRRLQLDHGGRPALDLIYGPNEAGKSTTLRAILALFYGLEHNSPDARLFGPDGLRIRARISDRNGEAWVLARVKGRKATLRGAQDEPLDESRMRGLLGDLPQPVFRTMFGLDHQRLREGGEQLRNGQGELGESLFQAGLGGAGVHRLLQQLTQEADDLFRPTGRLPALNDAIRGYREAGRRARDATTRAESFRAQQEQLDLCQRQAEELRLRRRALLSEQTHLRRVMRALPGIARRRELLARRAALGDVVRLPEDSALRRARAQRELEGSQRERKQLATVIAKLQARRAELDIPESLAELHEEVVRSLRNRLGNHLKALEDLPRRRSELRARTDEARALLRELGQPLALDRIEMLRVDRASQAHVAQLAGELGALQERLAAAEREREVLLAERVRIEALAREADRVHEREPLARALVLARAAGDVESRLSALRAELALERRRIAHRLSALGLGGVPLEALAALPWPSDALIAEYRQRIEANEREAAQLHSAMLELERRTQTCEQALQALQQEGAPPTETELNAARLARDRSWESLRGAIEQALSNCERPPEARAPQSDDAAGRPIQLSERIDSYLRASRFADALVDRLRREAERVSRLSALVAERASLLAQRESLRLRVGAAAEQRERLQQGWEAEWRGVVLQPGSYAQMQALGGKVASLIERVERSDHQAEQHKLLAAQAEQVRHVLDEGLRAAGEREGAQAESLASVQLRAEEALQRIERAVVERAEHARESVALSAREQRCEQSRQQAAGELARCQQQWAWRMEQLRLRPDASVPEALAVLEARGRVLAKADEIRQLRGRIDAMEEDAKQFRRDVHALMDRHLFSLRELVVEEAADELARRYDKARADVAERARLDRDIDEARRELAELERTATAAEAQLAQLQQLAAVEDAAALELAERRSQEWHALERGLNEVEDELLRHGEGATLDELAAQAAAQDADRLHPRLLEIEGELEELDERYRELLHQVGRLEQGMQSLEQDERAAEAAADAEQQLSRIKAHGHSYIRRKLAIELLQREIRRYRDANQGPVVERASELFARLTVGQHRGLRVGFGTDDRPVLVSIDAQGRSVQVEALSDGSRDQLYLALRLASLERFIAHREPLPLLLDDALIHFDDERARAALEVLGDFAATTQVLFFTHHARLLELARQAIPQRLVEHRLNAAARCHRVANTPPA